ncbi:Phosphofurin acidic cluster sorting protein 1 [Eumeta japonica]|uniref:Phosphofurin acidic cluster sorting protein 1 n=1 Tax=Eumeta variegata TaxID=151549 RepID=A0A4C1XXA6_EUMVA|nr:Phosphofurin acidic cluster sorting protein 1 [Eumeta japonica]
MLQRRKKYKNRTILGYKTLAEGVIRMDQVPYILYIVYHSLTQMCSTAVIARPLSPHDFDVYLLSLRDVCLVTKVSTPHFHNSNATDRAVHELDEPSSSGSAAPCRLSQTPNGGSYQK